MAKPKFKPEDLEFSPHGYFIYQSFILNLPPAEHCEQWIYKIFDAHAAGKGIVIEAFRGSAKTTVVTQTFASFYIGHHPHTSNLFIQVGDASAQDNTAKIAHIIAHNPAWKMFFPHVVPDKRWGANGYDVMRNDIPYEEWERLIAGRKDPTFLGLGRTSGAIIGKRPSGLLVIDDIDNEITTSSDRYMTETHNLIKGTIFPAANIADFNIFIGTPWTENDTIGYVKSTGRYEHVFTPVYNEDKEPSWPALFPEEKIQEQRALVGEVYFAQMYNLDLEKAKGIHLKKDWLSDYPHEDIDDSWKVVIGMDFASTADKLKDRKADYCAIAVGRLIPGGGVILVDGFRGHVSQGEAIQKLESMAVTYPTLQLIAVEKEGVGGQFVQQLQMYPHLPIHPCTTADKISPNVPSARNKGDRFQVQMAPVFQRGAARLSNKPSPFLNTFRNEWVSWPLGTYDDTLDAVYYMLYAATMFGGFNVSKGTFGTGRDWRGPKKPKTGTWEHFRDRL